MMLKARSSLEQNGVETMRKLKNISLLGVRDGQVFLGLMLVRLVLCMLFSSKLICYQVMRQLRIEGWIHRKSCCLLIWRG